MLEISFSAEWMLFITNLFVEQTNPFSDWSCLGSGIWLGGGGGA